MCEVINYKHRLFDLYQKLTSDILTDKEMKELELLIRWDNELEKMNKKLKKSK